MDNFDGGMDNADIFLAFYRFFVLREECNHDMMENTMKPGLEFWENTLSIIENTLSKRDFNVWIDNRLTLSDAIARKAFCILV
jgi:hypothetical protein